MIDVSLIEDLCFTMDLFECLTCRLIVAGVHYILCCIYRPPQSSVNNFLTYLRDNILSRFSKNSKIILVGDININLLNPLKITSISDFVSMMCQYNYSSIINVPTKYNPGNPITIYSILDQIWTNFVVNDVKSGAINTAITDHFPSFIFFGTKFRESPSLIKYRIFSMRNYNNFKHLYSQIDFADVFSSNDVDGSFDCFYNSLYKVYENAFPFKRK